MNTQSGRFSRRSVLFAAGGSPALTSFSTFANQKVTLKLGHQYPIDHPIALRGSDGGLLGASDKRWVILLVMNIILLVLRCFMEGISTMILTVPVLLPVIHQLGIDPVHFGVVTVMNLQIGLLHPPFGMALFVVAKVGNIPYGELGQEALPIIPVLLIVLAICTFWPDSIMFLPRLVYGT